MAKIIQINTDTIFIGMDDGGIKEVPRSIITFEPYVNEEVEIFENKNRIIVIKKQNEKNINNNNGAYAEHINKTTYCLLAFFLGGIGIHKFYAGDNLAGILYLLFCWTFIPCFLALIDFVSGLCMEADKYGNISFSTNNNHYYDSEDEEGKSYDKYSYDLSYDEKNKHNNESNDMPKGIFIGLAVGIGIILLIIISSSLS